MKINGLYAAPSVNANYFQVHSWLSNFTINYIIFLGRGWISIQFISFSLINLSKQCSLCLTLCPRHRQCNFKCKGWNPKVDCNISRGQFSLEWPAPPIQMPRGKPEVGFLHVIHSHSVLDTWFFPFSLLSLSHLKHFHQYFNIHFNLLIKDIC